MHNSGSTCEEDSFPLSTFSEFKYSQDDASVPGPSASSHSKGTRSAIFLATAEGKQDDNIKARNCLERLDGRAHTLRPADPTCAWQGDQVRVGRYFLSLWCYLNLKILGGPSVTLDQDQDQKNLITVQYQEQKNLTNIQDQDQDWKVWPPTRWEDRVALEDAETEEQIRYGELSTKVEFFFLKSFLNLSCLQKVEALACALTQRGFGEGDVIAVLLPNCIQVQTCSAFIITVRWSRNWSGLR